MLPLYSADFTSSGWHLVMLAMLFALIVLALVGRFVK